MKKLMLALGAVVAMTSVHAATMKWGVSGVTAQGTATTEDYAMLCFISADTTGAASSMILSTSDATALVTAKNFASLSAKAAKTGAIDDEGYATTTAYSTYKNSWINGTGENNTGKFYAIIFNSDDVSTATHYMITSEATVKYGSAANTAQTATLAAGTWQPISADVPEPTSGLLMLLGVAGLALRRPRA